MTSPLLTDGILTLDKAQGMTSMEVVRQVKRLTGHRHVGHGGTLDPEATGVLPIFLGQATRLMEYLLEGEKEYLGTLRLGIATDTYDAAGRVTEEREAGGVTRETLEEALSGFRGVIRQTPPMHSALKWKGQRLYELARRGVEVEREPRTVEVSRLDLLEWQPPYATLAIQCGRGAYIRSLAHDVGQALGCGAHLAGLRRTRTGAFRIGQAVTLEQLREAIAEGQGTELLLPVDYAVLHFGAVVLNSGEERMVRSGQPVRLSAHTHSAEHLEVCRAYSQEGRFAALLRFNRPIRLWEPHKVFQLQAPSPYAHEGALV
ncbi:MAG: tRNA pseudouridine(55) synthase TruB [Chloroflexi bacterium]|nr:tRNA pseudouridine(55) synthase TruB [Chloroflexota bacterium]